MLAKPQGILFPSDTNMALQPLGNHLGSPAPAKQPPSLGAREPRVPRSRTPSSPYLGQLARSRQAGGRAAAGRRGSSRKPARPASGPWRARARRRSGGRNARHAHR